MEQNPDMTNAEVSRTLAEMWKEAPEEVKQQYVAKEQELRKQYLQDAADFRESSRKEIAQKRQQREEIALQHVAMLDAVVGGDDENGTAPRPSEDGHGNGPVTRNLHQMNESAIGGNDDGSVEERPRKRQARETTRAVAAASRPLNTPATVVSGTAAVSRTASASARTTVTPTLKPMSISSTTGGGNDVAANELLLANALAGKDINALLAQERAAQAFAATVGEGRISSAELTAAEQILNNKNRAFPGATSAGQHDKQSQLSDAHILQLLGGGNRIGLGIPGLSGIGGGVTGGVGSDMSSLFGMQARQLIENSALLRQRNAGPAPAANLGLNAAAPAPTSLLGNGIPGLSFSGGLGSLTTLPPLPPTSPAALLLQQHREANAHRSQAPMITPAALLAQNLLTDSDFLGSAAAAAVRNDLLGASTANMFESPSMLNNRRAGTNTGAPTPLRAESSADIFSGHLSIPSIQAAAAAAAAASAAGGRQQPPPRLSDNNQDLAALLHFQATAGRGPGSMGASSLSATGAPSPAGARGM